MRVGHSAEASSISQARKTRSQRRVNATFTAYTERNPLVVWGCVELPVAKFEHALTQDCDATFRVEFLAQLALRLPRLLGTCRASLGKPSGA